MIVSQKIENKGEYTMTESNNKIVYVKVKVVVNAESDVEEIVSNMNYNFDHDEIIDTEILGYEEA